jgi:hypothetical protein
MDDKSEGFIIEGIREDGARFRPGDWIDRLSTLIATFGPDHRLFYAPEVQPCLIEGERCLVISRDLEHKHPEIYQQIMQFARDNQLRTHPDRRQRQLPVSEERRRPR